MLVQYYLLYVAFFSYPKFFHEFPFLLFLNSVQDTALHFVLSL